MSRTRRIRRGPDPAGGEARKTASPSPDEDAPDVLVVAVMDQREVMKEEERWLQEGREVRMAGAGRGYERSATRCPWTLVPPAAYRGYKDVNDAWAAGVLAVGAWPAALGAGALAVPAALCEVWAEAPGVGGAPCLAGGAVRLGCCRASGVGAFSWVSGLVAG